MTALAQRPAGVAQALGALPLRRTRGWRPALRLARRDAARHPLRTGLAMVMVGLPVMLAVVASVLARTWDVTPAEGAPSVLGRAEIAVTVTGSSWPSEDGSLAWFAGADVGARGIPATGRPAAVRDEVVARAVGSPVVRLDRGVAVMRVDDRTITADLAVIPTDQPITAGVVRTLSGRAPAAPDEVALSPRAARLARVGDGDTVQVGTSIVRVVGIGVAFGQYGRDPLQVVAAPGGPQPQPGTADPLWLVTDLPSGPRVTPPPGFLMGRDTSVSGDGWHTAAGVMPAGGDASIDGSTALTVGMVYVLAVIQIAALAAPALAVSVRRQRRTLALLVATGADAATLRRTVIGQALLIAGLGSLAGAGLGLLVAVTGVLVWWPASLGMRGPLEVAWVDVSVAVATGILATLIAAVGPATTAGRTPAVRTLAAGRGAQAPPWRRGLTGLVVMVIATVALQRTVDTRGVAGDLWVGGALAWVVVLVGGMFLVVPAVVWALGPAARWAPPPVRIAMRDASRAAGRSVAAVAAVAAAMSGTVAAMVVDRGYDDYLARTYVPRQAMGLAVIDGTGVDAEGYDLEQVVATAVPGVTVRYLGSLGRPEARTVPVIAVGDTVLQPVVADVDALRRAGLSLDERAEKALAQGRVLVPALLLGDPVIEDGGPQAPDVLFDRYAGDGPMGGYSYLLDFAAVMTPDTAERLGGWSASAAFLQAPGGKGELTESQARDVDEALAANTTTQDLHVYVERGYRTDWRQRLIVLVLVGAALIALVLGSLVATALALTDARRDRSVLAAVGAAPRTSRVTAGSVAAVYAGAGAVLGALVGLAPGLVITAQLTGRGDNDAPFAYTPLGSVLAAPWPTIIGLVIALPLVLGAAVAAASRPPSPLAGVRTAERV